MKLIVLGMLVTQVVHAAPAAKPLPTPSQVVAAIKAADAQRASDIANRATPAIPTVQPAIPAKKNDTNASYVTEATGFEAFIVPRGGYKIVFFVHFNGALYAAYSNNQSINIAKRINGTWQDLGGFNAIDASLGAGLDLKQEDGKLYLYWQRLNPGLKSVDDFYSTEVVEK